VSFFFACYVFRKSEWLFSSVSNFLSSFSCGRYVVLRWLLWLFFFVSVLQKYLFFPLAGLSVKMFYVFPFIRSLSSIFVNCDSSSVSSCQIPSFIRSFVRSVRSFIHFDFLCDVFLPCLFPLFFKLSFHFQKSFNFVFNSCQFMFMCVHSFICPYVFCLPPFCQHLFCVSIVSKRKSN